MADIFGRGAEGLRPMEACIYAVLPVLQSDHPAKLEIASRIMERALREDQPPECDGLCVMGYDVLGPEDGVPLDVLNSVAEAHPGCPLHAPNQVCGCGMPDHCMSPTHGRITLQEALAVRYRQNPSDPRAR